MNPNTPPIERASVKVMRSYNYCHFEVVLGTSSEYTSGEPLTTDEIDALRKEAARLADKAVEQYKVAQRVEQRRESDPWERKRLGERVQEIRDNKLQSEWTPEEKAAVKKFQDDAFWARRAHYDYEDAYNYDDGEEWED